ncbi:MAG: MFS transporter [bacterium]|nr:MFS transporter [Gammaproteobacteria bacterium]HIL97424.1 MFS transporter [Pseudomonadales bacterium]
MKQLQTWLSEWRIVSYAVLYLPVSVALLPVGVYVQPHYAELGISLITMAGIIFVARLSDVVTDPLIGFLSDKYRTPIGRRKPWIIAGTPFLMLSTYMLFIPGENPSVFYFGFWVVMIYLAFTIVQLPYFAWGAELTTDYNERTKITARREQFHYLGVVITTALPLAAGILIYLGMQDNSAEKLLADFSTELGAVMSARAGNPGTILVWVAIFILVTLPITVIITTVFVSEPDQIVIPRRKPSLWASIKVIRRNGPFMRLIVCYTVSAIGGAMTGGLSFFFVKHVINAGEWYSVYLLVYYLASVIGLFVWTALARKIGKHRAFIVVVIWYSVWASFIPFIPEGQFALFLFIMVMKGCTEGAMLALPAAMAADAVDIDSARTGEQRAGLYFSVWGMLLKGGVAAGGALALLIVGLFGFDATADPDLARTAEGNSSLSLIVLTLSYSIIPALIKFAALPFIWHYPLTEKRQIRIRERIERRGVRVSASQA